MKFEGLKLLPGSPLQLQFHNTSDVREKSQLIGYVKNRGIIVSTPMINGGPRSAKLGERLNVRLFSGEANSAVAFSSAVIHVSISPFAQLYIAYPSDIATDEIRKAARVSTRLISTAKMGDKSCAATIVDLSTSGCRIESATSLGLAGTTFTLVTKIEAAGSPRIIQLQSEIKVVINEAESSDDNYVYGLAFNDMSEDVKLVLHAFVYYQLRQ